MEKEYKTICTGCSKPHKVKAPIDFRCDFCGCIVSKHNIKEV